jgi:hypothetical protein
MIAFAPPDRGFHVVGDLSCCIEQDPIKRSLSAFGSLLVIPQRVAILRQDDSKWMCANFKFTAGLVPDRLNDIAKNFCLTELVSDPVLRIDRSFLGL